MRANHTMPDALVEVFQDTLDRPIAFHPVFTDLTGSLTAGLLLSQAVYWTKRTNSSGWFYKTIKQWEEETQLSRHEQESARKALRKFSFWHEERRGIPAQMYYKVDIVALNNELLVLKENNGGQLSAPKSGKPGCRNEADKSTGKRQTGLPETGKHYRTEITSETTTTTPLSPLQTISDDPGGRDFVENIIVGTMFQDADPGRIVRVANKYNRSQNEVETAIDVLDQQYHQSTRTIDDPTALVVCALKDGLIPPEGYVPKAQREKEAENKRASATKRVDDERRTKEVSEAEYQAAKERFSALSEEEREIITLAAKAKLHPMLRNSPPAVKAFAIDIIMSRVRAPVDSNEPEDVQQLHFCGGKQQ